MTESVEDRVLFEASPKRIAGYRRTRHFLWLAMVALEIVIATLGGWALSDPNLWAVGDGWQVSQAFVLGAGAVGIVALFVVRPSWLSVNRIAVTDRGFFPPAKPRRHQGVPDWFVPIVAIESMARRGEGTELSSFIVTLKSGLEFEVRCTDLLQFTGVAEAREYDEALRRIASDLQMSRGAIARRGIEGEEDANHIGERDAPGGVYNEPSPTNRGIDDRGLPDAE